jgi:hypothetical protein
MLKTTCAGALAARRHWFCRHSGSSASRRWGLVLFLRVWTQSPSCGGVEKSGASAAGVTTEHVLLVVLALSLALSASLSATLARVRRVSAQLAVLTIRVTELAETVTRARYGFADGRKGGGCRWTNRLMYRGHSTTGSSVSPST